MHRNPGMFLRGAGSLLRPTAGAVPRALTKAAQIPPPMRRLLLSAHCRSISRTSYGAGKDDAAAPVDIKEQLGAYEYVRDVPGLRARGLKVKLVPERVLQVIGERWEEEPCVRYLRNDRLKDTPKECFWFWLPQDADLGRVSAVCRDGVLRVTVLKLPSPGPVEIPRAIDVMP